MKMADVPAPILMPCDIFTGKCFGQKLPKLPAQSFHSKKQKTGSEPVCDPVHRVGLTDNISELADQLVLVRGGEVKWVYKHAKRLRRRTFVPSRADYSDRQYEGTYA